MKLLALICAVWCLSSTVAVAAGSADKLTADRILARFRKAWGGTPQNSQTSALEASITSFGLAQTVRIFTKAPNRVFYQRFVPRLQVVVQGGYDGRVAWSQVNLGGAGPSGPSETRFVMTQAATNNAAELLPGRWPMKSYRVPDETIRGKRYLRVYVEPRGGNGSTLLIDPKTYQFGGRQYAPDRYDICVEYVRTGTVTNCRKQDIYQRDRLVGTAVAHEISTGPIDDALFEMPDMPSDWTTRWILERYERALREPPGASGMSLVGLVYFRSYLRDLPYSWSMLRLRTMPPAAFSYSLAAGTRTFFRSGYDGTKGFVEHNGRSVSGIDNLPTWGMLYNHCELHSAACNVRVVRQPNVSLAGRQYYALTVVSISDRSQWYTVLLDEQSYLPAAIWSGDLLAYLNDYRALQSGEMLARQWTFARFSQQEIITNVAPAESQLSP